MKRKLKLVKVSTPLLGAAVVTLLLLMPVIVKSKVVDKPNVVLVLMDNFGWGELGVYGGGILRGAPTPKIDALAAEGMRLANFNVETVCSMSRAALMTGRYGIRTGATYPMYTRTAGLTEWEYTLAEMLSDSGYSTGIFGKWHLGEIPGRFPTDQGFDEWYGIPHTTNEVSWQDDVHPDQAAHPLSQGKSYIMQAKKGELPKRVKPYNLANRPLIDRELTDKAIEFMAKQAKANRPFFAYIPYTQYHPPVLLHPDFEGKTHNGSFADALAQFDHYTGLLLEAVDRLGLRDNTIFIFTSDNGGPGSGPWSAGDEDSPWGVFNAKEGTLRVPFIIRWPDKIEPGSYNNEIVHQMDIFPTLARLVDGIVPTDRAIDGVDQLDFFLGNQEKSNREGFVIYGSDRILGVKWRNWKMIPKRNTKATPDGTEGLPIIYNLYTNLQEKLGHGGAGPWWVRFPTGQLLNDHLDSLEKYPPIVPGTDIDDSGSE